MASLFKKQFKITSGKYGNRLSLFTAWTDEIEKRMKKDNIVELELNYAKGWKGDSLAFLTRTPNIVVLEIIDWNICNIAAIHSLNQLRALKVFTYCRSKIDFSHFSALEDASLEWRKGGQSIFNCRTLKKVFINNFSSENLEAFARLPKLESLSLKSPKIRSIGNISPLRRLTSLEIGNATRLTTLQGIDKLDSLEILAIQGCRKIGSIDPIRTLRQLKRLLICDCGKIQSLAPIENLSKLREVLFYESTNITDGDLTPLKKLPGLYETAFQDRKHYNLQSADFEK